MIVQKMREIDDIGHQQDKILQDIQSGYNMEWDKLFHKTDNDYHRAQYRDEKFKAAMKLNELIKEQNTFLHELLGQEDNPFSKVAKEKFDSLQKEIEALQQN
jgi:protein subunit release factor A